MGPIVETYGAFSVADDGEPGKLYGVYVKLSNRNEPYLIGSGMLKENALMVAEALNRVNAGNRNTTLLENGQSIKTKI